MEQFRATHNSLSRDPNTNKEIGDKSKLFSFLLPPQPTLKTSIGSQDPELGFSSFQGGHNFGDGFQNNLRSSHNSLLQQDDDELVDNSKNIQNNFISDSYSSKDDLFVYEDDREKISDGGSDTFANNDIFADNIIDINGDNSYGLDDGRVESSFISSSQPSSGDFRGFEGIAPVVQYNNDIATNSELDYVQSTGLTDGIISEDGINNGFTLPESNYDSDTFTRPNNFQNQAENIIFADGGNSFLSQPEGELVGSSQHVNLFNQENLASYVSSLPSQQQTLSEFPAVSSSQNAFNSNPTPPSPNNNLFKPPSTLIYGFKPLTTTRKTPPATFPSAQGSANRPSYTSNLQQNRGKVKYRNNKKKPSYKPPQSSNRKPKHLVLDVISKLLAPITDTINNLLKG